MVGRPGQYQFSFNAGELAGPVQGNTGLKQFYAGAALMRGVEPVPQGGFRLLPRSRACWQIPLTRDGAGRAAGQLMPFSVSNGLFYLLVLLPGQSMIFRGNVLRATIANPYTAAELEDVKVTQRLDTMLLWHPDHPPHRVLYNGSDTAWITGPAAFGHVPQVNYGLAYTNTVESWRLNFEWGTQDTGGGAYNPDNTLFTLSVNGQETTSITFAQASDLSTAIKAAIEQLPVVSPGVTVQQVGSPPRARTAIYQINFAGPNAGSNYVVGAKVVTSQPFAAYMTRLTIGHLGGEDLFSPSRGYPRCACFYQDRLALAGFRSKGSAVGMSRTGEYFDLNTEITGVASGGVLINLDTDGPEVILAVVQSKHLVIFTDRTNHYVADRAVSATAAPSVVTSSALGVSSRVPVIKQEDGLLWVNAEENQVLSATYDAVSESYTPTPISLLSSHLMAGLRDAAVQRAHSDTDADRLFLPRDDGAMVVGVLLRNQEVSAFVRWETDGLVSAVAVDGGNNVFLLVERQTTAGAVLVLELLEDGLWLDAAQTKTAGTAQTTFTGFNFHAGRTVYAVADGVVRGPLAVSAAGAITLPVPALAVTVGRWTPPVAKSLPLPRDVAPHTVLKRPARVHSVDLNLIGTTALAVGANGRAARPVALDPAPMTGAVRVTGLKGWSPDGSVTITQAKPGALQVRDVTYEAQI